MASDTTIQVKIERDLTQEEIVKYQEVFVSIVACGALTLPGSGKAVLHFDKGKFRGIELSYWAVRRSE